MLKMYRYVKGNVPEVGSNVITNNPGMVLAHWVFFKSLKLCLSLLTFSLILTFCIFSFVLVYCSYSCVCGIPPISSRYIPCSPYIVRYSLFRYFLCYFDSLSFCQIYLPECCYQM